MEELRYPFDGAQLLKNRRAIRKKLLSQKQTDARLQKKIAVLGGSTTNDIVAMLELFLLDYEIEPVFYQSEYGQYWQDAMFPNEALSAFAPDLIFVHTSTRNITQFPKMTDSEEEVEAVLLSQYRHFSAMWEKLREIYGCPIIQNNFELPSFRLLGNLDAVDLHGRSHFVMRLNELFYQYAREHENFYINDIHFLSANYGLHLWSDPKYWYMYKYALCVPAIPEFSFNVANIIKSLYGKNKKVLVLDLDHTLWGGVIGDEGVNGIEIGQETPLGQAYYAFQEYVKAHQDLGVLLAISSKNDMENALAGLNHPDAPLKPDDFILIKANWENKAQNVEHIAQELDLLPESLVFVDDNPMERGIVRTFLGKTAVPEIDEVEDYIYVLDRSAFFEMTAFSEEDGKRGEMYKANLGRATAQISFADYEDYLKSLSMVAVIRDFAPLYLQRITQLTNKSNQFNLTTRRYTAAEMEAVYQSANYIRLYGRLIDRFGDNGIVSVVVGRKEGADLHVELWLMSCRVLKRGMEYAMLDQLVAKSREQGVTRIIGYYDPTAKNGMVRALYQNFGFTQLDSDDAGHTVWELKTEHYENQNHVIEIRTEEL